MPYKKSINTFATKGLVFDIFDEGLWFFITFAFWFFLVIKYSNTNYS